MTWLSWRQHRAQALVGVVAMALIAVYLVYTGLEIRGSYDHYLARCQSTGACADEWGRFQDEYRTRMLFLAGLLALIPALLGTFWGAPLIARELEAGTHRLVWNQSVTRRRWLAVKLLVVGLATMTVAGLASLMVTWAASPFDRVADDRFTTIVFGARNIAPVAYATLAVILGAVVGMLARRTIPAMALTMLIFASLQFVMPNAVRPHLMPSVHTTVAMTADAIDQAMGLGGLRNEAVVRGLTRPDSWITDTSQLLTADGRPLDPGTFNDCLKRPPRSAVTGGRFGDASQCLGALNLHVNIAYQPNHRYWPFQWLETAVYLVLGALLAAFALWRVQRPLN